MKILTTSALLLFALIGSANDGFSIETGSAINFSKSPHVQMVSEDIRIWLDDDQSRVEVDFVFKNHGPRHTVTMAFPDSGYNAKLPSMVSPRSWVDGRSAALKFQRVERPPSDEEDPSEHGAWTKRVEFAKGQTRRVRFAYKVKHSWNVNNEATSYYVLKTGATWRGRIQQSKVTVDWSKVVKRWPPIIREMSDVSHDLVGSEWRYGNKRATRTYRNFVPDFDLAFEMMPSFRYIVLNGVLMEGLYPRIHFVGDPSDLEVPVSSIPRFFQSLEGLEPKDWSNPVTRFFGGTIAFSDHKTMLLGGRRTVPLNRPIVTRKGKRYWSETGVDMVYLKDVIEGVGGSYRYDPRSTRLSIDIPKKGK